jgi:hypothetical protein
MVSFKIHVHCAVNNFLTILHCDKKNNVYSTEVEGKNIVFTLASLIYIHNRHYYNIMVTWWGYSISNTAVLQYADEKRHETLQNKN